jgi:hypothetical protein
MLTTLNQENSSKQHVKEISRLFQCDFVNMTTGATNLHQSVQGGHPFINTDHLDENLVVPTKFKARA